MSLLRVKFRHKSIRQMQPHARHWCTCRMVEQLWCLYWKCASVRPILHANMPMLLQKVMLPSGLSLRLLVETRPHQWCKCCTMVYQAGQRGGTAMILGVSYVTVLALQRFSKNGL